MKLFLFSFSLGDNMSKEIVFVSFETRSHVGQANLELTYIPQDDFEILILLPQDYRHMPPCLARFKVTSVINTTLLLRNLKIQI